MSEQTTNNFWSVIQQFQWPKPESVSYKLYHDDQGAPLFYSMEILPGTYIEVDQATYIRASHHVKVIDGKLIVLEPKIQVTSLQPDPHRGRPCHPRDVCVVVDDSLPHQKWTKTTNDID